jgi:hypothetical protein
VGLAGQFAFSEAVMLTTGERALVLPHMTAHLVDMGPGYRFIKAKCPAAQFAVCGFEDRLPLYWEDFIGNRDPRKGVFAVADMATKHRLSDEQMKFALAVFKFDPVGVTMGFARDAASQITRFSLRDLAVTPEAAVNYATRYPRGVSDEIIASTVARHPQVLSVLSKINLVALFASIGVVGFYIYGSATRRLAVDPALWRVSTFIILAVVINAIVCGVLASPYDRFQARVIWLVPLVALLLVTAGARAAPRMVRGTGIGRSRSSMVEGKAR